MKIQDGRHGLLSIYVMIWEAQMKKLPKPNYWIFDFLTPEEEKNSILNYQRDYNVIMRALEALRELKDQVLPKHINLQTRAFSVILEQIWDEIQRIYVSTPSPVRFITRIRGATAWQQMFNVQRFKEKKSILSKQVDDMCNLLLSLHPRLQAWYDIHGIPDTVIVQTTRTTPTEGFYWERWLRCVKGIMNDMSVKHSIVDETDVNPQELQDSAFDHVLENKKHHEPRLPDVRDLLNKLHGVRCWEESDTEIFLE